jgi:outer membrane protein W
MRNLIALLALSALTGCDSVALLRADIDFAEDSERSNAQEAYGIEFVSNDRGLGVEWGGWATSDQRRLNGQLEEVDTLAGYVGARYTGGEEDLIRPYIGAGLEWHRSFIDQEAGPGTPVRGRADAKGAYIHVGAQVEMLGNWFFGVDARLGAIGAEHSFDDFNLDVEADYTRLSGFIGLRF